jgi:hypothetical protein
MAAGDPAGAAPGASPGPGVDRFGTPVVDPTQNVLDLVNAAIKRQDDLREMQARYVARIGEMREEHATYIAELRALYQKELREAETARIDAIRAVDVGAVNRAAEVSATQAATLATQVATSAEALRGQVEAARQQTATALSAALEPIIRDIADLRKSQYEAQGIKAQTIETRDVRGQGTNAVMMALLAISVLISLVLGIFTLTHG